ncbi:MAG TPA: SpoIIE family protein phosphatase, partial [Opitutales bacterium]|nr:SpoIIE family protein phosphatase [Opitutales bacterium]
GTVMGIPGGSASTAKAIELGPGDRFYAFTDGIVEASAPDGEEFGMERLIKCFEKHADESVQQTQKSVFETVATHTRSESQQDDITLLAFELS